VAVEAAAAHGASASWKAAVESATVTPCRGPGSGRRSFVPRNTIVRVAGAPALVRQCRPEHRTTRELERSLLELAQRLRVVALLAVVGGHEPREVSQVTCLGEHGRRSYDRPGEAVKGFALTFTRLWLPLGIAVAGVILIVLGHASVSTKGDTHSILAGAGVVLLGVALMVWMVNWLFRLSLQSNRERDEEERAREYFDRHGHWPGEDAE
jgi:hypothetical protein